LAGASPQALHKMVAKDSQDDRNIMTVILTT
jgi:hypothetical protein